MLYMRNKFASIIKGAQR